MHPAGAGRGKTLGIAQLIIVDRMRQRHHDCRTADDAEFGDGRGTRPADHEMGIGDPPRHVHEEGMELAVEMQLAVGLRHLVDVLGPHLLGEP